MLQTTKMGYVRRKYRRRGAKKAPGKRRIVRKALRKAGDARIARVVKRVMSRTLETKVINVNGTRTPCGSAATVANLRDRNIIWVSPSTSMVISQGVAQNNRIGNKIRTKSCKCKILMYPKPLDSILNPTPRPVVVTIWCVSAKQGYVSSDSMATLFDGEFFQNSGSSAGYQSDLTDCISDINKDVIILHWKRTYKVGHNSQYGQSNVGTAPYPGNAQYGNNDYKMNVMRSFDLTKALQKTYDFNDSAQIPNDRSTFLVFGVANADGQQFASGDHLPLDVYFQLSYAYTDA